MHNLLSYSNACKIRGNDESSIFHLVTFAFSGQLSGWWDNHLTPAQRAQIINSVKCNGHGKPILNAQGQTTSDAIYALLTNIL